MGCLLPYILVMYGLVGCMDVLGFVSVVYGHGMQAISLLKRSGEGWGGPRPLWPIFFAERGPKKIGRLKIVVNPLARDKA